MNKYLKLITEYFPDWTEIYKSPEDSTGGKFIKSFSKFLDNIDNIVRDMHYIDRLHVEEDNSLFDYEGLCLNKIDYISKVDLRHFNIETIKTVAYDTKDNDKDLNDRIINIQEATSNYQFFTSNDLLYYVDNGIMYINQIVDGIQINSIYVNCNMHHIWGPYDEIGLLIGLERQPGELNKYYANRLKDHYKNLGNSSPEKLKSYICRCLIPYTSSLNNEEDSLIQLKELTTDYVFSQIADGKISDELKNYIEISKKVNKNYTNSYWDVIEKNNQGLKFLPISWYITDSNIDEKFFQNGVLTPDSLKITPPELGIHPNQIEFAITAKSIAESEEEYFPETEFSYDLIYKEKVEMDGGVIPDEPYTLTATAYETVNLEFDLVAKLLYENLTSTVLKPYVASEVQIDVDDSDTKWEKKDGKHELSIRLKMQKRYTNITTFIGEDAITIVNSENDKNLFSGQISPNNNFVEIIINESDGYDEKNNPINTINTAVGITLLDDYKIHISEIKDCTNINISPGLLGVNTSNREQGTSLASAKPLLKSIKVDTNEETEVIDGTQVYYKEAYDDDNSNSNLNAEILIKLKSNDEESPEFNALNIIYKYNDDNNNDNIRIAKIKADQLKSYISSEKDYNIDNYKVDEENYLHLSDSHFKINIAGENNFKNGEYVNTNFVQGKGIGFLLTEKSN